MSLNNLKKDRLKYKRANLLRGFDRFVKEMIEDRELVVFTRKLKPGAKFAIFGGMLRDISLFDQKSFCSDIDVVVDQKENTNIVNILKNYDSKINSFGGFRVKVGKWTIDLWMLENTWAIRQGIVKEKSFKSLIDTTFFNWDAIALELGNKKNIIHCRKTYFEDLENRYLTINLEQNPNPPGVVARTLRHFIIDNAKISKELAYYIIRNLNDSNKKDICNKTLKLAKKRGVTEELIELALKQIYSSIDKGDQDYFYFIGPQLELSFENGKERIYEKDFSAKFLRDNLSKNVSINYVDKQMSLI